MKKTLLFLLVLSAFSFTASSQNSQPLRLTNFIVKENLLKNEKIAIIAADNNDKPLENFNGNFQFTINGFKQSLRFNDGVAIAPQPIDKSTFIYLRHTNETGTYGKLYYVLKKGTDLNPIKVNWVLLVLIPLGIIFITMLFKKFLIIAIVLLLAIFYFNSDKGLTMPTFFDTIFDGLKSLF